MMQVSWGHVHVYVIIDINDQILAKIPSAHIYVTGAIHAMLSSQYIDVLTSCQYI